MGALDGLRVIELSSERSCLAGKLLADMGADVVLVEPPGGCPTRAYGPFVDDVVDPEGSLWWLHYNTSKRSIVLDLGTEDGRSDLRTLVGTADVVLEAEPPGRLAGLGVDWAQLGPHNDRLVWVSITPEGRDGRDLPVTDLTLLAEGGPVWSCGYDDHDIPPVRGGGNQGFQTACNYAVMSLMVALLSREETGRGQLVDVSMLAAANVTTEFASYTWLISEETVQRQTGRHATVRPSEPTQVMCADGRWLNTGVPPRRKAEFAALREWIEELGLADECPFFELLKLGDQYESISIFQLEDDPLAGEVFQAGRDTFEFLAAHLPAYELFVGLQSRGLACGIIYSPEEMLADPHFVERGFPVEIEYDSFQRTFTHPGAPYKFGATPWHATRAPRLAEHQDEVLGQS